MLLNLRYQLDVCVGANTIRPSKKQTHGNNKVRQQKKFSPTILNLQQILNTGERCSPVEVISPRQQQGSAAKKILPDNSEFTANPEHGRTLFAPTDCSGEVLLCKIATLDACPHLCSALPIPHSSFLTPHSSFLIPHSSFLIPHSSLNTAPLLHSPTL